MTGFGILVYGFLGLYLVVTALNQDADGDTCNPDEARRTLFGKRKR